LNNLNLNLGRKRKRIEREKRGEVDGEVDREG